MHVVYRPYVMWRIAKPSYARVSEQGLATDPLVFHPVLFFSTKMLIGYLRTLDLAGQRFLDVGTGTGAIAIFAATRGATVTCCDINARAVELARANALANRVDLEVLDSDLFASLSGRQFDLISFNLPFYPRAPRTPLEAAFFAGPNFETIRRFAEGCTTALSQQGTIVVIFSEDTGRDFVVSIFAGAGFAVADHKTITRLFERHHVVCFRRPPT
jgi:release factor glutamine methyltransferase